MCTHLVVRTGKNSLLMKLCIAVCLCVSWRCVFLIVYNVFALRFMCIWIGWDRLTCVLRWMVWHIRIALTAPEFTLFFNRLNFYGCLFSWRISSSRNENICVVKAKHVFSVRVQNLKSNTNNEVKTSISIVKVCLRSEFTITWILFLLHQ